MINSLIILPYPLIINKPWRKTIFLTETFSIHLLLVWGHGIRNTFRSWHAGTSYSDTRWWSKTLWYKAQICFWFRNYRSSCRVPLTYFFTVLKNKYLQATINFAGNVTDLYDFASKKTFNQSFLMIFHFISYLAPLMYVIRILKISVSASDKLWLESKSSKAINSSFLKICLSSGMHVRSWLNLFCLTWKGILQTSDYCSVNYVIGDVMVYHHEKMKFLPGLHLSSNFWIFISLHVITENCVAFFCSVLRSLSHIPSIMTLINPHAAPEIVSISDDLKGLHCEIKFLYKLETR